MLWPALALSGLFVAGDVDLANEWMKGLAKTSMQGPYRAGAFYRNFLRARSQRRSDQIAIDQPYINDWACVSGCNYLEPIVDSLFGINAGLFGGITAKPQFRQFRSRRLSFAISIIKARLYTATKNGIKAGVNV